MATHEAYMLGRDSEESKRLDTQHIFMRALADGKLIQKHVPVDRLRTIADVGTGTGVWLREVSKEINSPDKPVELVGFDISAEQFPKEGTDGVELVVHDLTQPFPSQYHGKFDLINIRLLSYALKAENVEASVKNLIEICKPGGYIQWQEIDSIDSWSIPQTPKARSFINYLISERIARGLTPAIATPIIKALQSHHVPVPAGKICPIAWTGDVMRVLHLDLFSTMDHPSPIVQGGKGQGIKAVAMQLLSAALSRRKELRAQAGTSGQKAEEDLSIEIEDTQSLLDAWQNGTDPACNEWNLMLSSIVAQKSVIMDQDEPWLIPKY